MRQMGLSPPIELMPVPTVIDQVPEEDEDDGETVHETDIEVQELIEGGQNVLMLPSRWQFFRPHLAAHYLFS